MRPFSVLLTGNVEDAFVYRTTLVCWTFDRQLLLVSIADLEEALTRELGDLGIAMSLVLFHSAGVGASHRHTTAWRDARDDIEAMSVSGGPVVAIDIRELRHTSRDVDIESRDLLDLLIFWDTIYLATDAGLYTAPFLSEPSESSIRPQRRLRHACYSAVASLGAVAASCAEYGLRVMFDERRFLDPTDRPPTRVVADLSLRAEYVGRGLLNYWSPTEFQTFEGSARELRENGDTRIVLTGLRKSSLNSERAVSRLAGVTGNGRDADFVFSWRSRLYILAEGLVRSVSLYRREGDLRSGEKARVEARYAAPPISAVPIEDSLLLELSDSVLTLSYSEYGDTEPLDGVVATGPVVALRSFPRSHRYRYLALATSSTGLWLMGLTPQALMATNR